MPCAEQTKLSQCAILMLYTRFILY